MNCKVLWWSASCNRWLSGRAFDCRSEGSGEGLNSVIDVFHKGQRPFPPLSRKTANGRFFFNPHPPSSKRPFQSGKIFQHFEGPFFEVALVSLLGLVSCSSITEESTGTSKTKLTVKKETTSIKTYLPLGKLRITSLLLRLPF